jgi:hypothetical protein
VHIQPIHTARRHDVAQALQCWAHQGGPTLPFIADVGTHFLR